MDIHRAAIVEIIQQEFALCGSTDFDPNGPIREKIDLDSMQLIGLISRLEQEFDIEIPIAAIDIETLNQFVDIIEGLVFPQREWLFE